MRISFAWHVDVVVVVDAAYQQIVSFVVVVSWLVLQLSYELVVLAVVVVPLLNVVEGVLLRTVMVFQLELKAIVLNHHHHRQQ